MRNTTANVNRELGYPKKNKQFALIAAREMADILLWGAVRDAITEHEHELLLGLIERCKAAYKARSVLIDYDKDADEAICQAWARLINHRDAEQRTLSRQVVFLPMGEETE